MATFPSRSADSIPPPYRVADLNLANFSNAKKLFRPKLMPFIDRQRRYSYREDLAMSWAGTSETRFKAMSFLRRKCCLSVVGALLLLALMPLVDVGPASALPAQASIGSGQFLSANQSIVSPNGAYTAVFQTDGNFVVYGPTGAIWSTRTNGSGAYVLAVQRDGNVVAYSGHGAVWNTRTSSFSSVSLVMQNDGNLVLYNSRQALWSSKGGNIPLVGTIYGVNQPISSPSGQYNAILQPDGNFVVYRNSGAPTAIWSSGTVGSGAYALAAQGDGNLVLYSARGPVWASRTFASVATTLAMQDDGNLVLYAVGGVPIWNTGTDLAAVVVKQAKSQLGYAANPLGSNCNVFTAYFGRGSSAGCSQGTSAEAWCSDFAEWVWFTAGAGVTNLSAWSYNFVYYGQAHGTFKQGATNNPQPGDAVVWGNMSTQYGDHVGIVVAVNSQGQIQVVNGNDGNDHVSMTGFFNPTQSTVDGDPIVGYTSPLPAAVAAFHGGASIILPTPTQDQINSQH
jgi:CHAP domain